MPQGSSRTSSTTPGRVSESRELRSLDPVVPVLGLHANTPSKAARQGARVMNHQPDIEIRCKGAVIGAQGSETAAALALYRTQPSWVTTGCSPAQRRKPLMRAPWLSSREKMI